MQKKKIVLLQCDRETDVRGYVNWSQCGRLFKSVKLFTSNKVCAWFVNMQPAGSAVAVIFLFFAVYTERRVHRWFYLFVIMDFILFFLFFCLLSHKYSKLNNLPLHLDQNSAAFS